MPSDLFSATYSRGGAASAVDGEAWLQALLDVEAALARAGALGGLIPAEAQAAIVAACASSDDFDLEELAAEAGNHATPVVGLVRELRSRVGSSYEAYVHLGATSQDIVDTAAMLVAKRALNVVLADAAATATACAMLADRHRDAAIAGRTLLQQALPTSFGLIAAGWLVAIDAPRRALVSVVQSGLAVQMGGPVGAREPEIAAAVAAELGLAEPVLPWHTDRNRIVALAAELGRLSGSLAKVARDVTLLAQTEIGELSEGGEGRGGSSAMAHKHNPVAAVSVLACTGRVPGLVATVFAGMEQELQRAAGAWQAEWGCVSELLSLTGSATAWARDLLENLQVDPERMRANLAGLAEAGAGDVDARTVSELIDRALGSFRA